jgi:hypothetical protein
MTDFVRTQQNDVSGNIICPTAPVLDFLVTVNKICVSKKANRVDNKFRSILKIADIINNSSTFCRKHSIARNRLKEHHIPAVITTACLQETN